MLCLLIHVRFVSKADIAKIADAPGNVCSTHLSKRSSSGTSQGND